MMREYPVQPSPIRRIYANNYPLCEKNKPPTRQGL
jgi:hypothetical protein